MSDETERVLEGEVRWPDRHKGEYLITVRFRPDEKDLRAVGLSIDLLEGEPLRSLRTSDLRRLRLPLIIEQAAAKVRVMAQSGLPDGGVPQRPLSHLEYLEHLLVWRQAEEAAAAGGPRAPGRPGTPLPDLEQAAAIYAEAFSADRPPTQTVAERQGITHAAATRRIARARKLGLLGPAEQGKASVGALRPFSDTQSLISEIARLRELKRRHDLLDAGRFPAAAEEEPAEPS
jgi:hypothetical protein